MERASRLFQEFWRSMPVDQQLLSVGATLLAFGFALLFWTPLGNRPVARYCFGMAVLCHLLLWGMAKQFAPASGPLTQADPKPSLDIAIDSNDSSPTETDSAAEKDRLQAAVLDPRDRSQTVKAPESPTRTKDESPLANRQEEPPAKAPESPKPAEPPPIQQALHLAKPTETKEEAPPEPAPVESAPPRANQEPPKVARSPRVNDERLAVAPDDPNADVKIPTIVAPKKEAFDRSQKPFELAEARKTEEPELYPAPAPADDAKPESIAKKPPTKSKSSSSARIARSTNSLASDDRPTAIAIPVPKSTNANPTVAARTGPSLAMNGTGRPSSFDPDLAPAPAPADVSGSDSMAGKPSPVAKRKVGVGGDLSGNRSGNQRKELLERFGGNSATEEAVGQALAWLAAHQSAEGKWDGDGFHKLCPGGDKCEGVAIENDSDMGISALALLAFLGAGHTHRGQGQYRETVRKGLNWILLEQGDDGHLLGKERLGRIYSHAMATLALTEAYQMTDDERLRPYCQKAVDWLVRAQHPELGGWRYSPRIDSDTSVFGWAVLALASARQAGFDVPESCWVKAQTWLPQVSSGAAGGLACYQPGKQPSPAMTAEALVCRQLFGLSRSSETSAEAAIEILKHAPSAREMNLYFWYYGSLAMFHVGGPRWERWNEALQQALLAKQRRTGHLKGSWDPVHPWGVDGGRVFSTAASALCLEVYYRHLPIYKETSDSR
jgi:hypothetical protein